MVMASVVGPKQSYWIPGRTIQDNLFLLYSMLEAAELFGLNISVVSP